MDVTVRVATTDDWPAMWSIIHEVAAAQETFAMTAEPDEAATRVSWMTPPPGRCVVAVDSGSVLGTSNMYANRENQGSHVASGSIMVAAGARGQGVGRALTRDMVRWATDAGYIGIQFNAVVATNTGALHLYESEGFRAIGAAPGAFRHPAHGFVDLLILWRDLS